MGINVEDVKAKVSWKLRSAAHKTVEFYQNNKELVLVGVPIVVGLLTQGVKAVSKHHNVREQERVKEEYCYDRSLGHYWALRRKLTNAEWVAVDKRKKNGERLADILDGLKVLK